LPEKSIILRGRNLSPEDIKFIKETIVKHWDKGRSFISRELCQHWRWYQENGRLKDQACRAILLSLERRGYLRLPPRKREKNNCKVFDSVHSPEFCQKPLCGKVGDFRSLTIELVRLSHKEPLWDYLVERYHYLGNPGIVGSYLKYLVYLDGQLAACLGWGAAAWRVTAREQFIGWNEQQKRQRLHLIANNVRFLILPWIKVKHLASKVLAANIKILPMDWQTFYGHRLVVLETFVDIARYRGTSYRAGNWLCVGQTKGVAKSGNRHIHHGRIKAVYLYPLSKDFRERLTV